MLCILISVNAYLVTKTDNDNLPILRKNFRHKGTSKGISEE